MYFLLFTLKIIDQLFVNIFLTSVWLNEKAEKRRSQEWENEQSKKLEEINEEIRTRLSQCFNINASNSRKATNITDITGITCPKELFEIMESSNDPETIEVSICVEIIF